MVLRLLYYESKYVMFLIMIVAHMLQNLIFPSATCSWVNINQSDLKNKYFIFVKFMFFDCTSVSVIHL